MLELSTSGVFIAWLVVNRRGGREELEVTLRNPGGETQREDKDRHGGSG